MSKIDHKITCNLSIYFFPESLLIKKMINPMTAATANIPTQKPALKMSPTNSQLVNETEINRNNKTYSEFFIMLIYVIKNSF
jgi:hypothetical protein